MSLASGSDTMTRPTHYEIAGMDDISELVFAARCRDRKVRQELAHRLILEEAERRIRLQLVLEIASRVSRPSCLLAALKFCGGDGGLTQSEIRHVLVELPGRALRLDDDDSDGCFVDLALERLANLGYRTTATKGLRLTPSGDIRDYLVYRLAEDKQ